MRNAAPRAVADDLNLKVYGLTPELAELICGATGCPLLTYLKREELVVLETGTLFDRTAEDTQAGQIEVLGTIRWRRVEC